MSFEILPVKSAEDIAAVADLFRSYAAGLPVDLSYQDFEGELASLPGKYAPPRGALFLARLPDGKAVGCVGSRACNGSSEIKRLYVEPEGRGLGIGRALLTAVIEAAERAGYREMLLDTLPTMKDALRLYAAAGFVEVTPYYDTPVEGTVFLSLRLGRRG